MVLAVFSHRRHLIQGRGVQLFDITARLQDINVNKVQRKLRQQTVSCISVTENREVYAIYAAIVVLHPGLEISGTNQSNKKLDEGQIQIGRCRIFRALDVDAIEAIFEWLTLRETAPSTDFKVSMRSMFALCGGAPGFGHTVCLL